MSKLFIHRNAGGIDGLCVIESKVFKDARGYLMESYNAEEFEQEGLGYKFVQDNEAFSRKGVLRGFHVNKVHPQAKLVRVVTGEIFDVAIDLRPESVSYKKWYSIRLSGENKKQLYIPEGFGHGYLALEDSLIQFKVTTHYIPGDEIGFSWKSKAFDISWPISNPIQNEKDKNSPEFSNISTFAIE